MGDLASGPPPARPRWASDRGRGGDNEVLDHRPCFEVTFSDGSRLIADAEHQWRATSRAARRAAAERTPPRYYFDPAIIARVAALADATPEYDGTYVTMAELVSEVGSDLRHVLHSVGREIGPAVEMRAMAVGETTRRRVVYPRPRCCRCSPTESASR